MAEHYVYIYYDPTRSNEPIYVGKGICNRAWDHLKNASNKILKGKIERIRALGKEPLIGLYGGLDEELSFLVEQEFINKTGRMCDNTGPLANFTLGGDGCSGYKWNEEQRQNHSLQAKGRKQPDAVVKAFGDRQRGVAKSETAKAKISATLTGVLWPKTTCPHCGKNGGENGMKRWHFDKCPTKKESEVSQ